MTKSEAQKMHRLELENLDLRERVHRDMSVYADNLIEIIELKATIELIRSALEEQ